MRTAGETARPRAATFGPWIEATPARHAIACSVVTSLKPTIHLGRRANSAQGRSFTMRIAP